MKHINVIILLVALLSACKGKEQNESVSVSALKHEVLMDDSFLIGQVREMTLMDDSIPVLLNNMRAEKAVHILDYVNQRDMEVGNLGQGPDEFLFPSSLSVDGQTLSLWDINKKRYSSIRLSLKDSTFQISHRFSADQSLLHTQILPLSDNTYLATGFYEKHRFILLDENGGCIKGMEDIFARDEEEKKISGFARAQVYQGKMVVNPSKTKLLHALTTSDILSFYDIQADGTLKSIKEEVRSYPKYNPDGAQDASSMTCYYMDAYATDQYVYLLYSGRKMMDSVEKSEQGNTIYVFDWEGNKVKEYQLDIDIANMCVTKDDSRIFAIAYLPDPILVSFTPAE